MNKAGVLATTYARTEEILSSYKCFSAPVIIFLEIANGVQFRTIVNNFNYLKLLSQKFDSDVLITKTIISNYTLQYSCEKVLRH